MGFFGWWDGEIGFAPGTTPSAGGFGDVPGRVKTTLSMGTLISERKRGRLVGWYS